MQKALVYILFFLGVSLIVRTLIDAIPRWKAKRRDKEAGKDENP